MGPHPSDAVACIGFVRVPVAAEHGRAAHSRFAGFAVLAVVGAVLAGPPAIRRWPEF